MRAISVNGEVEAESLGFVLPHEHVYADARFLCQAPSRPATKVADIPQASLRASPMNFVDNLDMRDESAVTSELDQFVLAGGKTLVELTTIDLGRDPNLLRRVSSTTGLNLIMSTGYYVGRAHPAALHKISVERIAREFELDIRQGRNGIRAGVIGEIGTDDPLDPREARVVRAAAQAHLSTGCPVNIHFAAKCHEVLNVLRIMEDEGVRDFSRIVVSHMDVAIDLIQQKEVAARGAMVEYDTFGHEGYPDSKGNLMPQDEDRVAALSALASWGLLKNVLVSHDVCLKSLWHRYGGRGYDNLLSRIRPMMTAAGLGDLEQHQLFVTNPARVFAFLK